MTLAVVYARPVLLPSGKLLGVGGNVTDGTTSLYERRTGRPERGPGSGSC